MHTQTDTAQLILGRHADYVVTVKANMPTLYRQLKKLPWKAVPAVSSVSKDHGRRARRTIKAALAPAWTGFEDAAQLAELRRTVTKKGKKTVEVVYLITSDRHADPATLAAWVRGHWEIENRLHWVRDVTYQEDNSMVRTGNAPRVTASLRSWRSASCDWTATITSPPPTGITPRPAADAKAASGCMNATLPFPWELTRLSRRSRRHRTRRHHRENPGYRHSPPSADANAGPPRMDTLAAVRSPL
jgi:predicted transposase YbfD/YdcC